MGLYRKRTNVNLLSLTYQEVYVHDQSADFVYPFRVVLVTVQTYSTFIAGWTEML